MRLFYAINFSDEVKQRLIDIQGQLRAKAVRGNFTQPDNLHLTLAFIGEVEPDRSGALREIAESFQITPFDMHLEGIGRFRRDGGDIIWVGIKDTKSLAAVYNKLTGQITNAGFNFDKRKFTPHLTLARDVRSHEDFALSDYSNSVSPIIAKVTKISLMKSERLSGTLTYTEVAP